MRPVRESERVCDARRSPIARRITVLHHPSSAAVVRRKLAEDLRSRFPGWPRDLLDDAAVVATELVGNAVRHANPLHDGVIEVDWRVYPEGIRIRVVDGGSPQVPTIQRVTPDAISGRGLAIVAALARRWGVTPVDGGRCVWAWLVPATQVAS